MLKFWRFQKFGYKLATSLESFFIPLQANK